MRQLCNIAANTHTSLGAGDPGKVKELNGMLTAPRDHYSEVFDMCVCMYLICPYVCIVTIAK